MATRAHEQADDAAAKASHDAFVRAKVEKGLAQSRDRSTLTPIDQVWRDFATDINHPLWVP